MNSKPTKIFITRSLFQKDSKKTAEDSNKLIRVAQLHFNNPFII